MSTCIADIVAVSVAFSCLSKDTATATKIAPAAVKISTDSLIAVPKWGRKGIKWKKKNIRNMYRKKRKK